MEEFQIVSVARGHHVYKSLWTPHIGEVLAAAVESDNSEDDYVVSNVKGNVVVGREFKFSRNFYYWFYG